MKSVLFAFSILFLMTSCKSDKDNEKKVETNLTIAEKIANANGFENWKDVSELEFTFNVDKDTTHSERSWIWKPKTNDVTFISKGDTLNYNRKSVDSLSLNANKAFVNDKFWLLAPFQLVWDNTAKISEPIIEKAPISKKEMNKITLTYPSDGGYTPGDAYDFYYGDDFIIQEWNYRQGNSKEPSMSTTWEDYDDYNGIKLAKSHKRAEGDWNLHFTNIKVVK